MKKWIVLVLVCFMPVVVHAGDGCRVYEYAEIKDMTDTELKAEIDRDKKLDLEELGACRTYNASNYR